MASGDVPVRVGSGGLSGRVAWPLLGRRLVGLDLRIIANIHYSKSFVSLGCEWQQARAYTAA